jgi:hypothetical protein
MHGAFAAALPLNRGGDACRTRVAKPAFRVTGGAQRPSARFEPRVARTHVQCDTM